MTASAGDYRARVHSALGEYSGLPYKLNLILSALPTATPTATAIPTATPTPTATVACPADPFEPNGGFDQARYITQFASLCICPRDDEDWFKFTATASQELEITLYNLPADFDLEVYGPDRSVAGDSHHSGTQNEMVRFTANVSGEYRIRVYNFVRAYSQYKAALLIQQLTQPTPLLLSRKKYSQPFDLVVGGARVWWGELSGEQDSPPGGIYTSSYGGDPNAPATVYTTANFSPADLAYDGGQLYVREWEHNWIMQVQATPAAPRPTVLAVGQRLVTSRGIEVDALYTYWGDQLSLYRQRLTTQQTQSLVAFGTGYNEVQALTSDGYYLYWTDVLYTGQGTFGRVHKIPKNGSAPVVSSVAPQPGALKYVDVVNHSTSSLQNAYVASDRGIYVGPLDGVRPLEALYTTEPGATITGMTVDATYIYWTEADSFTNALLYMPRAGGGARVLLTGLNNPRALAQSGQWLYWSEGAGVMMARKPQALAGAAPMVSVRHAPREPSPGNTVLLTAEAQDADGIHELQIYVDGRLVKSCRSNYCTHNRTLPNYATVVKYEAIATDTRLPVLNGIDWNCNGVIEASVKADINDDIGEGGGYTTLVGRQDWSTLPLKTPCLNPPGFYSNAYYNAADSPPCVRSASRLAQQDVAVTPDQEETPHPDPDPFEDPIWQLPHELCDGLDNDANSLVDDGCPDADGDTVADSLDNCPFAPNPDQADAGLNWVGDACDAPPAPPDDLTAENVSGGVRLSWAATAEPDVTGYIVLRTEAAEEPVFQHLGDYPTVGVETTTFFDRTLTAPGRYRYQVLAVNRYSYESDPAEIVVDASEVFGQHRYLPLMLQAR